MEFGLFREKFDPCLQRFLRQKQGQLTDYTENKTLQAVLGEPLRLVQAGGKRLRPFLCYLGYQLAGGQNEKAILETSVMLEVFHLFALIHDDIMDRGEERHGIPCVHRAIERHLEGRLGDLPHVAASQAMIVGDLLFAWSVDALFSSSFSPEAKIRAQRVFQRMCDEVMMGQMLDVDLTTRDHSSLAEVRQKMILKTAGYTFVRPLQLGMALSDSGEKNDGFAEAFGTSLGVAFQTLDDVLDAFGTLEQTGKTPLSDLRDHQHTVLTQWLLERGAPEDRHLLEQAWGMSYLSSEMVEAVRLAYVRSGALERALVDCSEERNQAIGIIESLHATSVVKESLQAMVEKAVPLATLAKIKERLLSYVARAQ